MRIEKKIWPEFYEKIADGTKKFEIRLGDFVCNPGDTLVLREWDPATKQYTGRDIEKEVTYVLKTNEMQFWAKEDAEKYGFQVIALK